MVHHDHPWPALTHVGRGTTRGNQGCKGFMGPPDEKGRCILELRVRAGGLRVKLNPEISDLYRIVANEVDVAAKQSKLYWRKARRRQDYDPRADQDHMELHEWLQQLKDRMMSHIETLIHRGEISGPPFVMRDDVQLPFMKGFVERHLAGIPHHPRHRNSSPQNTLTCRLPATSDSCDDSEPGSPGGTESLSSPDSLSSLFFSYTAKNCPPTPNHTTEIHSDIDGDHAAALGTVGSIMRKVKASNRALRQIRDRKDIARATKQEFLVKHLSYVEAEGALQEEENAAQRHKDQLVNELLNVAGLLTQQNEDHSMFSSDAVLSPSSLLYTGVEQNIKSGGDSGPSLTQSSTSGDLFFGLGLENLMNEVLATGNQPTQNYSHSGIQQSPEIISHFTADCDTAQTLGKRPLEWNETGTQTRQRRPRI